MTDDPVLSATTRGHLSALLHHVATLSLSESWWAWILDRIDALDKALAAGDADATRAVIIELERVDEIRATRLGAQPTRMPDKVRERYNRLVHTLSVSAPGGSAPAPRPPAPDQPREG